MSYQIAKTPMNRWMPCSLGWLVLASFPGFGSRTLHKLKQIYAGNGDEALRVSAETLTRCGCREKIIRDFHAYRATAHAEDLARVLDREEITFLLFMDEAFPPLLRQIADPPLALFVRGQTDFSNLDGIAIVGTRRLTPYGKHVASWLSGDLARAGFAIVSGLAGGIDAVAHEAALDAGGRTIAVLASGVDNPTIYPRANLRLAIQLIEHGGSLISESPPGTLALPFTFPLRNRIISGISRATIVVEGAEKSGSLITAHQALEQNREVLAVPGPITHAQSQGTNRLLSMGAIPCTSPEVVIRLLRHGFEPTIPRTHDVTDAERALLDLLAAPLHTDDIARQLRAPVAEICARLVGLELKGLVTNEGANIYARSKYWN